ncbi:MAG TPA: ABC-F family ATP-binding cassette domain-containing protein, partial [Candidatus Babeliaceae bacterium]|nr:ABC-F family ATP-binding cassette domain-containing protein [Candidatus Babeliaceae bacterium]
ITFTMNEHDRIGLIGRNGSGKTTLLKAILNPSILDSGIITVQSKKKIAYMEQEVVLNSPDSILEETLKAFPLFYDLSAQLVLLERELENSPTAMLLEEYASIQERLAALSPELLKSKSKKILMGLGFSLEQLNNPVNSLSVGWKMRIVLAKLLLQEADFYLFDEPTNHLDLIAKEWFLGFLKQANFGFILICHEKYFLDELCEKILELEHGKALWYIGNYNNYLIKKEHDKELLEAAYIQQQKDIQRKQATIERFRASASKSKMALSMEKSLEKLERIEIPPSPKNIRFSFPTVHPSARVAIKVNKIAQSFGSKLVFDHISLEVERGQKVALVAPNGGGKTTLFNCISGLLPLQRGSVTFGDNVKFALFAQDQNKALNINDTILDNIKELCPAVSEQRIRSFLGAFLFTAEDIFKKVKVLSGGEKNRVGMVSVLLQQANLLLLDEPTNHLDIPSKEILLKALQEYSGTILFVSHDRDFINSLATEILELTPHACYKYHGNYDAYIYQKQHTEHHTSDLKEHQEIKKSLSATAQRELVQEIKRLEAKATRLEREINELLLTFESLEYGTKSFMAGQEKLLKLQRELKLTEDLWEQAQQRVWGLV